MHRSIEKHCSTSAAPRLVAALALSAGACIGSIGDGPGDGAIAPPKLGEENCVSGQQDPGPYVIPRLTVDEYIDTVRDSLGVEIADLRAWIPPEQPSEGFLNDAAIQIISFDHVQAWADVAEEVVTRVGDFNAFVGRFTTCFEFEPTCKDAFVANLVRTLYRRPSASEHTTTLMPIFDSVLKDGGSFVDAAKLIVRSMLQSPWFLYRVEAQLPAAESGRRMLDDYEIASRLSYVLWGSSPDEELYAAAAAGTLATEAGMAAQVDRMLASDRAVQRSLAYLSGWLHFQRLPQLDSELRDDLRQESEAFFSKIVWEQQRSLTTLLTAPFTIASRELATHYGFDAPQDGLTEYDLSGVSGRRGILTHGSVLSAGGAGASLTLRGLFLLNNVLCSGVPPPPPGVNNTPPPTEPGKSQRYYAEQRMTTEPCSNCHRFMDPLAFAFSTYDAYGAPRELDEQGNALRTDGVLTTPWDQEGKPFADTDEFIDHIVAEPKLAECMVTKIARFAMGRAVDDADACTLAAVGEIAKDEALTYQNVIRTLVMQPGFRAIRAE